MRDPALEARLARHQGLIWRAVRRTPTFLRRAWGPAVDDDDLFQDYATAAMRALRAFDPGRGLQESTLVSAYLDRVTKHYIYNHNRQMRRIPLGGVESLDVELYPGGLTAADAVVDAASPPPEDLAVARAIIAQVLAGASPRERVVLRTRARGGTLEETCLYLEAKEGRPVTREWIRQVEKRALAKIRRRIGAAA